MFDKVELILVKLNKVGDVNHNFKGATVRTIVSRLRRAGLEGWRTKSGGEERNYPSESTVRRMAHDPLVKRGKIQKNPGLTELNKTQRLNFAQKESIGKCVSLPPHARQAYLEPLYKVCHVDESWIYAHEGTGEFWLVGQVGVDGKPDFSNLEGDARKRADDFMKGRPHKFLVFAVTTTPKLLNPLTCHIEGAKFHDVQNGIVYIERICSVTTLKSGPHAGEKRYGDLEINATVYKVLMKRAAEAFKKYLLGLPYNKLANIGIDKNLSTKNLKKSEQKEKLKQKEEDAKNHSQEFATDVVVGDVIEINYDSKLKFERARVLSVSTKGFVELVMGDTNLDEDELEGENGSDEMEVEGGDNATGDDEAEHDENEEEVATVREVRVVKLYDDFTALVKHGKKRFEWRFAEEHVEDANEVEEEEVQVMSSVPIIGRFQQDNAVSNLIDF